MKNRKISLIIFISVIMMCMLGAYFMYSCFGHKIIKMIYEGKLFGALNKIMQEQIKQGHPVEYFFSQADRVFVGLNIVFFAVLVLSYMFLKLSFKQSFSINRPVISILVLIILLGGFMRVFCFSGFMGSDDIEYSELAYRMEQGEFSVTDRTHTPVFPLRVGLLAPVVLGYKFVGINELVTIMYPFILSMLGIILVFLAAAIFFNARAGLIAALMQAILPLDVIWASRLCSDIPGAFWANAGIIILYYGSQKTGAGIKNLCGVFSGFALGLSWLCRESTVYLLPFIAILMALAVYRQRRNVTLIFAVSLAVLMVFVLESLSYYKQTHDFLFRYHEIERNYEVFRMLFFSEGSKFGWVKGNYWPAVAKRVFVDGPRSLFVNLEFGLVTFIALFAVVYAVIRKKRVFFIPGIWFISLALMFNFGSSSLKLYRPLVLPDRYMYSLIFPAILLTSGLFDEFMLRWDLLNRKIYDKEFFGEFLLIVGVFLSCLICAGWHMREGIGSPVERVIAGKLRPYDQLYTDERTAKVLNFFWKYPKNIQARDFQGMEVKDIPKGSYVLINREREDFINLSYNYILPKFYKEIPSSWLLQWSKDRGELYRVP